MKQLLIEFCCVPQPLAQVGTLPDCLLRVQVGDPIAAAEAGSAVDTGKGDISVLDR